MKIKTLILSNFIFGLIGFIIGIKAQKKPPEPSIVSKAQTQQQTVSNNNAIAIQGMDKQIVSTINQYYPSGHIEKTTKTSTNYTSTIRNTTATINNSLINGTLTKNSIISPQAAQKNWMLGGFLPTSNYKDYSDYTLQASYRIVGPIIVSFQSNLIFTRPMVGFQIQL